MERLRYITRRSLVRLGFIRAAAPSREKDDRSAEIEFQSLKPVTSGDGDLDPAASNCVCPVTRQPLQWGSKIFQCRKCLISYSAEGWEFLRKVDGGRCCGCRSKKTVFPLR